MNKIIVNGDIVYVVNIIKAQRNINPNTKRKEDEVIIFGFNKKLHPELYKKYMNRR